MSFYFSSILFGWLASPLTLRSPLCAGLWCVYLPTSGDGWFNQNCHSDGTCFFSCYDFCVIYLPIVCFLKLAFPALDLFCCFGLFVWLSTHLDLDLGEQNITQGRLSCSANPHWLTVTLRPLWPGLARSCTGNWFSINESSLFLVSALMCLNMSTRGHIHQNMFFQFYQEYLCSAEKRPSFSCVLKELIDIQTKPW